MSDKQEDQQPKQDKDAEIAAVLQKSAGSLFAALGIYFVFSITLSLANKLLFGNTIPDIVKQSLDMAVLIGLLLSDPVEAWREKKIPRPMWLAMAGGALAGVIIQFYSEWALGLQDNMIYALILMPMAIFPLIMAGHALKKLFTSEKSSVSERGSEAILEFLRTSGPLVMSIVLGVCMLFFYVAQLSQTTITGISVTMLSCMIVYAAWFYNGEGAVVLTEDIDLDQVEKPESSGAALSAMLQLSVELLPGCIYITSLAWISFGFWDSGSLKFTNGTINPLDLMYGLLQPLIVSSCVILGGMIAAQFVGSVVISIVGNQKKMGIGELEQRVSKFTEMLYCGAIGRLMFINAKSGN